MRNRIGAGKGMSLEMGRSLCEGTRSQVSLTYNVHCSCSQLCLWWLSSSMLVTWDGGDTTINGTCPTFFKNVQLVLRMSNLSYLSESAPLHPLITSCSVLWVQYDR